MTNATDFDCYADPSDRDLDEAAAHERALDDYQRAFDAVAAAGAAATWTQKCRLHDARVALSVWWDEQRYGAINAQIVADILAEREARHAGR